MNKSKAAQLCLFTIQHEISKESNFRCFAGD